MIIGEETGEENVLKFLRKNSLRQDKFGVHDVRTKV